MKVFSISVFSILFVFTLATTPIRAQLPPDLYSNCDFCMCSMGISPLTMNGSSLRLDSRYTDLGQQYLDGKAVPFPTDDSYISDESFRTVMLSAREQVTDGLSATLMVPFKHTSETEVDPGTGASTLANSGVGDMMLILQYRLLSDHEWANMRIVAITTGVKFANGSTSLTDAEGRPADPDVQLGTGTTDFYAGLSGLLGFSNWNIQADGLGLIHGFGSGASGHTYGSSLNYDLKAEYRLYIDPSFRPRLSSPTVFASLAVRGELRSYETQDGQPLDNDSLGWSGGNVVYAAPGFQLYLAPRVSLDASVWFPILHALPGDQLGETIKAMAGIQLGL